MRVISPIPIAVVLLILATVLCLWVPYEQHRPYFQGKSMVWHWGRQLDSDDPKLRSQAASVLAEAVADSNPTIRSRAIEILTFYGSSHIEEKSVAVPALRKALDDGDPNIRLLAAEALKHLTGK